MVESATYRQSRKSPPVSAAWRKCADCGFLTQRSEGELIEVSEGAREGRGSVQPICFAREYRLGDEYAARIDEHAELFRAGLESDGHHAGLAFRDLVSTTRDCDKWVEWNQGFTPKEHRDMIDRERLLTLELDWRKSEAASTERQIKLIADSETARRAWQDDQRKWREEDRKTSGTRFRFEIAVFGVLIAVATILGSMVEGGIWTPPGLHHKPQEIIALTPTPVPTPIPDTPTPESLPTPVLHP